MEKYLDTDFNFDYKIINFVNKCSKEIEIEFENLKEIEEYNQLKILNAFKFFLLFCIKSKSFFSSIKSRTLPRNI